MQDQDREPALLRRWQVVLAFILIFISGLWLLYAWGHLDWALPLEALESLSQRGLFGDSFGALNALFSGVAFGGVILTLLLQTQELREQRKQLKAQEHAIREQTIEARRVGQSQIVGTLLNEYGDPRIHEALAELIDWCGDEERVTKFGDILATGDHRGIRGINVARRTVHRYFLKVYLLAQSGLLEETNVELVATPFMVQPLLRCVERLHRSMNARYDTAPYDYFHRKYPQVHRPALNDPRGLDPEWLEDQNDQVPLE